MNTHNHPERAEHIDNGDSTQMAHMEGAGGRRGGRGEGEEEAQAKERERQSDEREESSDTIRGTRKGLAPST